MATPAVTLRGATLTLSRTYKLSPLHFATIFAGCPSTFSNMQQKRMSMVVTTPSLTLPTVEKTSWRITPSPPLYSQRFFCTSSETEAIISKNGTPPSSGPTADSIVDSLPSSSSDPVKNGAGTESVESLPSPSNDPVRDAAGTLDIRVGRILKAWRHPEADTLYVEEVDVGEPEPRTICSGLVKYISLDTLQDLKVLVLANLKPRNMRGVKSNGMLLAASDASHENVELLSPPEGSIIGERIWFGSEEERENQSPAASPNQIQKKKIWELVQPHLKTDGSCVAALGTHVMQTSAGAVGCTSLQNANIG